MAETKLQLDKVVRIAVISVNEKFDSYQKKNTTLTMWCHFFVGINMETNEPHNFQICTDNDKLLYFEIDDIVNVRVKQYNETKNNYTAQFVEMLEKEGWKNRRKQTTQVAQQKAAQTKEAQMGNPVVAGTAADRALYAAAHLHHMRNSKMEDVMESAEIFFEFFMNKQK